MTDTYSTTTFARSPEVAELIQALALAQRDIKNPVHDSTNPHFKTRYASLAAVRDAITVPLAQQGIVVTQFVSTDAQDVVCTTVLWHSSGQYLSNTLRLPASKADAQGYGGTITYSRRYSLMALCNVAGDEDDDGEPTREPARQQGQQAKAHRAKHEQEQVEQQEWRDKITALLEQQGLDAEAVEKYWRHISHKYGYMFTVALGQKLHGELVAAAKKKGAGASERKDTPESKPAPRSAMQGAAWDTLRAYQADPRIPADILEQIGMALDADAPASESAAIALADAVLDWLNVPEEEVATA